MHHPNSSEGGSPEARSGPTRRGALAGLGGSVAFGLAGCSGGPGGDVDGAGTATTDGSLSLRSPAFDGGEPIPVRFTCEGDDVSPVLAVRGVPEAAASIALLVDDPDAPGGTFTHWLLWDVPTSTTEIPEGVPAGGTVPALDGARQGRNDAGVVGYSGPCPPPADGTHRYRFRLLALGSRLELDRGAGRSAFDAAVDGRIVADAVLVGRFER